MVDSIGGMAHMLPGFHGAQAHRPSEADMSARFEAVFGGEALAGVQNADGSLNIENVRGFMQDQGITGPGQLASAAGFSPGGMGQFDSAAALDRFSSHFGDEAAASVSNADGSINFAKMGDFMQSRAQDGFSHTFASVAGVDGNAITDRIVGQFGEDALTEITDAEGNIDPARVKDFMMEKVQSGEISPPFGAAGFGGGGFGGIGMGDAGAFEAFMPGDDAESSELFDILLGTLNPDESVEDTLFSLYA
ncbi:MAG: hypothetical protein AAF460_15825 [Pseudomonadota bacterium]